MIVKKYLNGNYVSGRLFQIIRMDASQETEQETLTFDNRNFGIVRLLE